MTVSSKTYLQSVSSPVVSAEIGERMVRREMEGFGRRLAHARKLRKLRVREVATALGISNSAVTQWELGGTKPDANRLISLPALLKVSPLWLLYDVGLPEPKESATLIPRLHTVGDRRVALVQAAAAAKSYLEAIDSSTESIPAVQADIQPNDFAVEIWDESNAPMFNAPDRVIMRPDVRPRPGDYVLAAVGEDADPVFACLGRGSHGSNELIFGNRLWGRHTMTPNDRIVAVVVAHISKLRR